MYALTAYRTAADKFMHYLVGTLTINHAKYTQSPAVVGFFISGLKFRVKVKSGMYELEVKTWLTPWTNAELWDKDTVYPVYTHWYTPNVELANQRLKAIIADVDTWLANFHDPAFVRNIDGVVKQVKYVNHVEGE